MILPISYNLRNLAVRRTTTVMTALGIGLQGAYERGLDLWAAFRPSVVTDELGTRFGVVWAARLVLVNDLSRSRLGYCGVWLACHLLTTSRIVRFDGPASELHRQADSGSGLLAFVQETQPREGPHDPCGGPVSVWRKHQRSPGFVVVFQEVDSGGQAD